MALLVVIALSCGLSAQHTRETPRPGRPAHDHAGAATARRPPGEPVRAPLGGVSAAPTPAFAADGRLWLAFVEGPHVYVTSSGDLGRSFDEAVRVTPDAEPIDANGESRPKIALGPRGEVYVTWTRKGRTMHIGDVRFARSLDGRRFTPPVTVNDDRIETTHRFDTLAVDPGGRIHVAWIDTRERERARAAGRPAVGADLYLAVSGDGGRSFGPNRRIDGDVCECCRVTVRLEASGTPVLLWRDVLPGNVRDHSLARVEDEVPEVRRVSVDDWVIAACPHQGPALSVAADGAYHAAWFSAGARQDGLFHSRSEDAGRTWSPALKIGSSETSSRADVLAAGGQTHLAWKESRPSGGTAVLVRRSADGGRTWTAPREAAATTGGSDHPLLLARGPAAFLSWFTAREGYRLVPLP